MNIAVHETEGIKIENIAKFTHYIKTCCQSSIFLCDCSAEEIHNIISELQNSKASDIPIRLIKATSEIICPVLQKYINGFMRKGKFPDDLKIGKVCPIYKKDNEELPENYRPVCTLPVFGKIFEKIIYSRLYKFFI